PLTAKGTVVGDIPYMSPECVSAGGMPVDGRADLYSLGAVLFAMVVGKPPFGGETVTELVSKIHRDAPPPLPGLPPFLERVIRRLLAKRPADRYPSAAELLADLEEFAKAEQVGY